MDSTGLILIPIEHTNQTAISFMEPILTTLQPHPTTNTNPILPIQFYPTTITIIRSILLLQFPIKYSTMEIYPLPTQFRII